jgi:capsular polysaccharide biosynthesis protein
VNDPDQMITWSRGDDLPDRLLADDAAVGEERPVADLTGGLVNLRFFTAALRRSAWVWCLTGALGLLIGSALYVKYPPAYHATASVLLGDNPTQDPAIEVLTDQSLAQSQVVAERVVRGLKLPQSVASFQAAYTVTIVTDTVLTLNVGAPSSADAVQRVSALADALLAYRAQYAQTQQQDLFAQLDQQYNAASQRLAAIDAQLSQMTATTPAQKTAFDSLQEQQGEQRQIEQYATSAKAIAKTDTSDMVQGSVVLNAATALPRSHIKGAALYVVGGLFCGIALGMGGIVVAALLSTRLRRRDDVAAAMGAPVRLSVGPLRARRWRLTLPRRAAKRQLDMRRVVGYLRRAVPGSSRGPASFAVVPVDDAQVAAQAVALLGVSYASENKQVVLADLSSHADLARLLGVRDHGIHPVSQNGANLLVVLPERGEVAPAGPALFGASPAVPGPADEALVTACSSADLLLTLATLDPAFGGDYLGTWATNAVAMVTAGQSSAEKVHGVGEMIRLAGTRLDSVVLIGADKSDESLGVTDPTDQPALVVPSPRPRQ